MHACWAVCCIYAAGYVRHGAPSTTQLAFREHASRHPCAGTAPCCVVPQLDLYYNGFCNSVLWQLFHYVPLNIDSFQKMSEHRAMQMQWQAYQVWVWAPHRMRMRRAQRARGRCQGQVY